MVVALKKKLIINYIHTYKFQALHQVSSLTPDSQVSSLSKAYFTIFKNLYGFAMCIFANFYQKKGQPPLRECLNIKILDTKTIRALFPVNNFHF